MYNEDQMSALYMAKWRMLVSPKYSSRTVYLTFSKEELIDQEEIFLIRKRMQRI